MTKHVYGCACCSADFGKLFRSNDAANDLREKAATAEGWSCNWGLDLGSLGRREFLKGGAAAAIFAAMVPAQARAQSDTTIVFTGGTILTVDEDFSEAEAIAIRGNRILSVGTDGEVRAIAGADALVVDLAGKTVLPGFVDPHTHVIAGSVVDAVMEYVGMARFSTVAEVLDHITQRAAETPAGEWLVFRNFDPAVQEGLDELTFADLDPISMDHPIFVFNASGHLAYANSTAFEVAGVPADVENPPGAEFVRDTDGNLTGVMKNNVSFLQVLGAYPALATTEPVDAVIGLLSKWSQHGLTTVSELSLGGLSQSPVDTQVLLEAVASGRLPARIRAYPFYTIGADAWDEGPGMYS